MGSEKIWMYSEGVVEYLIVLSDRRSLVNHILRGQCHGTPQTRFLVILPLLSKEHGGTPRKSSTGGVRRKLHSSSVEPHVHNRTRTRYFPLDRIPVTISYLVTNTSPALPAAGGRTGVGMDGLRSKYFRDVLDRRGSGRGGCAAVLTWVLSVVGRGVGERDGTLEITFWVLQRRKAAAPPRA